MRIPHSLVIAFIAGLGVGCAASEGSTDEVAKPDSIASTSAPPAQPATPASAAATGNDSLVAIADRSRILGDTTAPVWVVIISDFQCPYCKVWHDETFPGLKREFVDRGRIRLAYVNLPLPQHQHARVTAEMAFCAGLQGRFWEFHDAVFDTQDQWRGLPAGTTYFDSVAATAKLDRLRLRACMDAGLMRGRVEADYQSAVAAKVRSTPTFFVGQSMRLEGAVPLDAFRDSLNKVIRMEAPGRR